MLILILSPETSSVKVMTLLVGPSLTFLPASWNLPLTTTVSELILLTAVPYEPPVPGSLVPAATVNVPLVFCVLVTSIFPCLFVTDTVIASLNAGSPVGSIPINVDVEPINIAAELGLAENDVADGVVTEFDVVETLLVANAFCAKTLYTTEFPADIPLESTKVVEISVSSIEPESLGTTVPTLAKLPPPTSRKCRWIQFSHNT